MNDSKIIVILIILLFEANMINASSAGYAYEKREVDKHIIHVVTIDPKGYTIDIVKANEGAIGRETVSSMAKRSYAEIAINGGFFEIGSNKDGMPSGTLVIKGHAYNIKDQIQPLILINLGKLSIINSNPKDHIINNVSMISGIPLLISDGKIFQELGVKNGEFYTKPHARTALGIKIDGTIVVVVVEHNYLRDLTAITMGEVQSLIKEKGKIFTKKYDHQNLGAITLDQLKEILKEEFTSQKEIPQGLSVLELAELMKNLGCQHALNLDGGGSSTLWIKDKVINHTIGDTDEGKGLEITRPVSDAIVFKRK